jgi:hypothetical protein
MVSHRAPLFLCHVELNPDSLVRRFTKSTLMRENSCDLLE